MTYSLLYFGKELVNLHYADIERFFIEEKEESNKIEFKSYYSIDERNHTEKENGIIRTVCALLNSEGGLIIWGAPVGQIVEGKKEKIFKGELSLCEKLIEKDSFISRLTDSLNPSPKGIMFHRIQYKSNYLYIIEVAQSLYSPHQFRNIYYMRIDGQTKPAPHHYIEALFKKITFPKLEGYIKIESFKPEGILFYLTLTYIIFNKSKLQNEHDIYFRLIVTSGKFLNYVKGLNDNRIYALNGHELRAINAKPTLYYNEPLMETFNIVIYPQELEKRNYECNIMLYFGGKQSPLMISEYSLKLNNYNIKDMNSLYIKIDENKYIYEKSDNLEISEIDSLKKILGR